MGTAKRAQLTVGYLQVGPGEHGICRYGRMLAAEARRRPDLQVIEHNMVLTGRIRTDYVRLRDAARLLSQADLVHLQVSIWSDGTWGSGDWAKNIRSLWHLAAFWLNCRSAITVTLHDLNSLPALGFRSLAMSLRFGIVESMKGPLRPAVRLFRRLRARQPLRGSLLRPLWDFGPVVPFMIARWVSSRARRLFVLTGPERRVLEALDLADRVVEIPHFVERQPGQADATPDGNTVVVAGFMFQSKGHDLVIEAMALLPEIRVLFVGGASLGHYGRVKFAELMELARARGVADRLQVTGFLPDAEYIRQLAAARLAVCAFDVNKSASSSLSTLIAVDCPILASDIPLIAEYNEISTGAIPTFAPLTAEALASRIREVLAVPRAELTRGLAELRERLSIARILDRHVETYEGILAGRPDGNEPNIIRQLEPA